MRLILDNIRCVLTELTVDEINYIEKFLSKRDNRTGFVRGKFKADAVKTEKYFFKKGNNILIFTGLLKELEPFIKGRVTSVENHIKHFSYQREYTYDELRPSFNPNFKYVGHQIRALQEMLKRTKGVVKATTSAG